MHIQSLNKHSQLILRFFLFFRKQKKPNGRFRKEKTIQEDEILNIFMRDDLESFIKKSSETGFNPKSTIVIDSGLTNSICFRLNNFIFFLRNSYKFSYPQIMAFYFKQ